MNQNCKFKKELGILLDRVDGKYYAVTDFMAYELNEVGARILDLCNGENDILAITKKLSCYYEQDEKMVSDHVSSYINELLHNHLIRPL